jgi:hypothetical protein
MEYTSRIAVRQVLKEAGEHHRFFDLSGLNDSPG